MINGIGFWQILPNTKASETFDLIAYKIGDLAAF
jgi:hypothetical protein